MTDLSRTAYELQRLAAIVDSSDDAIVGKTLRGVVTSWNRGAERIFGYTSEEMVGRPITVLFPPDRLGEEEDFLARIARGEPVRHFETVRVRKDGQHIHVSVSLSPIRDDDGTVIGAAKIARDITESVKLRLREHAARQEAEAANRIKDEFLATLSHELRTPLNAIYGWVRMLQSGVLEPAKQEHALQVIGRNCQSQLTLINDLLDMSRIVTGQVTLKVSMLPMQEVIGAAVEAVQPMATEKGVTIQVAYEPDTPAVMGDAERLQQVVWNLLTNAVKFTDSGGRVGVRLYQAGSKVNVTVADDGVGIEPAALPHVFERFRQEDSSTTRRHGGLGLGLAIVRHFVELHGGTVRAWSEGRGRGATFTVSLPVAAVRTPAKVSDAAEPSMAVAQTGAHLQGVRVLIVDDDRDSRELIGEVMRRAGAAVFVVGSTANALGVLASESPDVIVSDLGMPSEDGLALIRRIRSLPDNAGGGLPVLALSAYTRRADQQLALAAGFDAHLAKPVNPATLIQAVKRLATRAPTVRT
jgi:PAS domain S-box-containing protein